MPVLRVSNAPALASLERGSRETRLGWTGAGGSGGLLLGQLHGTDQESKKNQQSEELNLWELGQQLDLVGQALARALQESADRDKISH